MSEQRKPIMSLVIPPVTEEFASRLNAAFPQQKVTPDVSRDETMYNAGQRDVVEWVLHHARGRHIGSE